MNAMLYIRGHRSDYDQWAELGNTGWSYNEVLPYFLKAEGNARGKSKYHNDDGPLSVNEQISPCRHGNNVLEAARQVQWPINNDFNGENQEGVGYYQVTQKNGERCSTAAAYIHPNLDRSNLVVKTGAQVEKIVITDRRATGVVYCQNRRVHQISANKEIIVCCGAFGSPQLLMLSGIGPASHLSEHEIVVENDLPGVGCNLQDHLDYTFVYRAKTSDFLGLTPSGVFTLIKAASRWVFDKSGPATTPFSEIGAFLKTDPGLDKPDIQLHFVIAIVDNHNQKVHLAKGYSLHVCVLRPKSRGTVRLASNRAIDAPLIDPAFVHDERDLDALVRGCHMSRQLLDAPAMRELGGINFYNEPLDDEEALINLIRQRADTIYHPVGTCKMGTDEDAVVSPQLRVKNIEGLRVADAAIMPTIIGGNTNAPTIMIAEKCADMILNGQ